ncbi:hypothetical protein G3576_05170 [Roseomonas stagni]|uniref:Uncharacterized protein n=1 Tax=Falsiroseomonas algicola TaxID=2716930 RepID=A0A6M1LGE3_9PROT|nr:hypothetical protein [Falsiroseomonas algicola]NGM19395.1 hypothetical protein [Falsiroseomonas algicola]
MSEPLTVQLRSEALVEFVLRRAAAQHRTPDSVIEELVRQEQALAEAEARPITLTVGEPAAGGSLLRDDGETEAEFASRRASFAWLTGQR